MAKKKFKFHENGEKFYIPKTKEELKKFIKIPDIDFKQIDTSKITDMSLLFMRFRFNEEKAQKGGLQDISNWDVSNVKNMSNMFHHSLQFNQDISNWDVSNVENMNNMFFYSGFNQNISSWDVSNVKNMQGMFMHSKFNQDISNWNVSNVKNMGWMFYESNFNQDISDWDVSNVEDMSFIFYNSKFSYFDNILEKWPKIINSNCKIEGVFSNLEIQKEFKDRIKKYQKLRNL